MDGYDIKIRFWVKPNPMISTFKRHVCPKALDEEEEEKLKYPDRDIWTRVIIESESSLWNFFL